jgi:AAA15 family ATPase/GTPase
MPAGSITEKEIFLFGHEYYDNDKYIETILIPEEEESDGTQKLFAYSIPVIASLENGTPLFIDEFDTQLHPLILESIIKLYNSPEKNKKNAQLVISCHAVNILTNKNFRRDQIWFCEKDQYGATDLYSLVEYNEPVRNDAAFGKNYLQGKYGAVPYINEIALQFGD